MPKMLLSREKNVTSEYWILLLKSVEGWRKVRRSVAFRSDRKGADEFRHEHWVLRSVSEVYFCVERLAIEN
jgi:hypothetical protein